MNSEPVVLTLELSEALTMGEAVVGLESTVIAQGLPWPENVNTARDLEAAVRAWAL